MLSGPVRGANDAAVVPPAVAERTAVPYPPDGAGDATVVLEVVVQADGTVSDVTVVGGAPPFSEHARQAVLGWRFVPAQRDGVAVAARIRVHIGFDDPSETLAVPGAPTKAPAPPATPAEQTAPAAGTAPAPVEISRSATQAWGFCFRSAEASALETANRAAISARWRCSIFLAGSSVWMAAP